MASVTERGTATVQMTTAAAQIRALAERATTGRLPAMPRGDRTRERADEEVLDGQHRADYRDVEVQVHLRGLHKPPIGLTVPPVVRRRERPVDPELTRHAPAEVSHRLDITVRPVDRLVAVPEVYVTGDEPSVARQHLTDLGQLLVLVLAHVLEEALGQDDIEPAAAKPDGLLQEICLEKAGRRVLDR